MIHVLYLDMPSDVKTVVAEQDGNFFITVNTKYCRSLQMIRQSNSLESLCQMTGITLDDIEFLVHEIKEETWQNIRKEKMDDTVQK